MQSQYERGLITDDERRQELINIWTEATNEVADSMQEAFPKTNPVFMMVNSGARGNWMQVRQIAGMRGLVANPKGEIIPRPIKSNFREGLSVLEYFISTHGARKGLADTALRTADSGYLTRRLVDVSQDVIIREEDCGTDRGLMMPIARAKRRTAAAGPAGQHRHQRLLPQPGRGRRRQQARRVGAAGSDIGDVLIDALIAAGVAEVRVRSVLTCESKVGTCAACYGRSLATGKVVDVGEAVGIIAAQSIGEPGTQLTMRTFHTGGVAGDDITHGLPRVVELFEARQPKGVAPISEAAGRVRIDDTDKKREIVVVPDDGSEETSYAISKRSRLLVRTAQHVEVGEQLIVGAIDPKQVLRILGPRQVQQHLVSEVQEVYRSQGVSIHDKHIEVIVRQMLKRVTIIESGDAELLPGELAERTRFEEENRRVVAEGGTPASGRPELMGITKASLATESWLSAASFQETTRVLTDAAIHAKSDPLLGLKENVIIGKLIPAGTGLPRYRNIRVEPTEEAKAAMYTMGGYDADAGAFDYSPVRVRIRPGRPAGGLRLRTLPERLPHRPTPGTPATGESGCGGPAARAGARTHRLLAGPARRTAPAFDLHARAWVISLLVPGAPWALARACCTRTEPQRPPAASTDRCGPWRAVGPGRHARPRGSSNSGQPTDRPQTYTQHETETEGGSCPPSSSWSARAARTRSRRPRRLPSRASPQRRGVCTRVYTTTPKKPNSALRKVARVTPHLGHRGHGLHPGRRPQPAGALDRARARRPGEGPSRRPLQDHPRLAGHPGRQEPQAGPQPLRREEGEELMPRKGPAPKRPVIIDPVYNSPLVTSLVNKVLVDGKRSVAERIVYGALEGCREKTGTDPVITLKRALDNVKPALEVKQPPGRWRHLPGARRGPRAALDHAGPALAGQLLRGRAARRP